MALTLLPMLAAATRASQDPTQSLAGRYYRQFPDGLVTGEKYTGEDIVEIVAVNPSAAYFRVGLDFYNGHRCSISGVAKSEGDALVYRDQPPFLRQCSLTIRRTGKDLLLDDGESSCKSYCGARGGLSDVRLPYRSKRPIRYLARLKRSREYQEAIAEWQKDK